MKKYFLAFLICSVLSSVVQSQKTYNNPILSGFYPDPSICQVGGDYYLINSTFVYFPGLPIFHSKDLVSWKQIGNAIDRTAQLSFEGAGVSRGLFAPAMNYHNGLFYIVCTLIDKGGNFVITAKNPAGPWSNPQYLPKMNGIDPSIFFDDNTKAYIVYNSVPPDNKSLYNGHRTIRMFEFDYTGMKTLGEEKLLVNGGVDISKNPVWIEAPHIFKKDDWYYLICAEGGTGYNHSEVVFRSRTVDGPYIPYENNPILTQRTLDRGRKYPITTTGHAEFVHTADGKWYAAFLGCRPYEGDHYNTGRETFLAPVTWKDGWPIINYGFEEVQYKYPLPAPQLNSNPKNPYGGNVSFKDDFVQPKLDYRYMLLRTPAETWYSLTERKGSLSIRLRPQTAGGRSNPSFISFRQQNIVCEASTSLEFKSAAENEKAGLIAFQSENHFYYLCSSMENNKPTVQLYKSLRNEELELLASKEVSGGVKEVGLKIMANGGNYGFYYSADKKNWQLLKDSVDGKFLSTQTAGGFVGVVFAMYATSLKKESNTKAYFNWFDYKGNDPVFKEKNLVQK